VNPQVFVGYAAAQRQAVNGKSWDKIYISQQGDALRGC
jgi:hypothetical protein